MSAVAPAHDGRPHAIEVRQQPRWQELVEHVEKYLTDDGRSRMYTEIGAALMESIRLDDDRPVNCVVEAWVRTLLAKQGGADSDIDAPDPVEEPVSLDVWRQRLTG